MQDVVKINKKEEKEAIEEKTRYLKLFFSVIEQEKKDLLIAFLSEQEFNSFLETETGLEGYIEKKRYKGLNLGHISHVFEELSIPNPELLPLINWNKAWEDNYSPIYMEKEKVYIRASFHTKINKENAKFEIIVNPKMSFGTGHHATTQLMIKLMNYVFENTSITSHHNLLDYGTGTGILAIYAALKGVKKIMTCDIDTWALKNAPENFKLNHCSSIGIVNGNIHHLEANFDFIIANINKNTLLENMHYISRKINDEGWILLSGFYLEDMDYLKKKMNKYNLKIIHIIEKNNWVGVAVRPYK